MSRLHTSFDGPQSSPGLLLWRVTNAWQRAIRTALAPHDLTHVQFVLLAILTASDPDETLTQRDLADRASTDEMMTSQVLRTLEQKGLVRRLPHPDDRRARAITPTPAGVALVNDANAAVETADRDYFAVLGSALPEFVHALRVIDRTEE
ncbi:MarR family winged helix-turn-helix transcriptional regulator [Leifsonia sp. LS-T14]|uniref:MarR family winged helix-turn-helix transcriptional regulator n=1 Tax=unclassified Leifsonia TaxID=2663824 RepID=UPI0035A5CEDE